MKIHPLNSPLIGEISAIGADKSISHRCAIFSLLSDKKSVIDNFLIAQDSLHSLLITQNLGAKVEVNGEQICAENLDEILTKFGGSGARVCIIPNKITEPNCVLECGNSGTSMRLFLGLLCGVDGFFTLSGDKYLNERPMRRVCDPLSALGAKFDGRDGGNKAPICVRGRKLDFFKFDSQISSAQVKTALILAAINGNGCEISEPSLSRDHTEKMLIGMGANLKVDGLKITLSPRTAPLKPLNLRVPADPSSAFFFAVAAAIIPGSKLVLKDVLLNKTRIEAYEILRKMGAKIEYKITSEQYEKIGEICVSYAPLHAVDVSENIPWLIDEAPALAVAFACADGTSVLRGAGELRVKECDRIKFMVEGLRKFGIKARELEDGFEITGKSELNFSACAQAKNPARENLNCNFKTNLDEIKTSGDHRIAMSFLILGLKFGANVENAECYRTSFPNFGEILASLGAKFEN